MLPDEVMKHARARGCVHMCGNHSICKRDTDPLRTLASVDGPSRTLLPPRSAAELLLV